MAREITIGDGTTGLTVTATPYLAGVAQSPISLTELGTTGVYEGDMTGSAGTYTIVFISSGTTYGAGKIIWNGTAEVLDANITRVNGSTITGAGTTNNPWGP
ncbi:hypothetical protein PIGBHMHK_00605 [Mycoplasmopsis arginini]|uniref:hypothetical protein n=1 Tax=Mycoplasmopsis arginini TaxID=2094 RepID=UPI00249DB671|nr:hypothetical protein [Mycoplasmopsis arginini]MDI3348964.1 hypothetical protein [Mycoplasmopsis arginini]